MHFPIIKNLHSSEESSSKRTILYAYRSDSPRNNTSAPIDIHAKQGILPFLIKFSGTTSASPPPYRNVGSLSSTCKDTSSDAGAAHSRVCVTAAVPELQLFPADDIPWMNGQ